MKQKTKGQGFFKKCRKYRVYLLMLLPAVIYTLIFAYYPMTGIVMAFKKYNYRGGIWGLKTFAFSFYLVRRELLFEILYCII